jgi:hypothetical protein
MLVGSKGAVAMHPGACLGMKRVCVDQGFGLGLRLLVGGRVKGVSDPGAHTLGSYECLGMKACDMHAWVV